MFLIRINSHCFPDRYKKYTNFRASYGFVAENGDLFLDPRYLPSAQNAGYNARSLVDMPRAGWKLDPWEFTIAEYQRFKFADCELREFEEYEYELPSSSDQDYLVSNVLHANAPCLPCVGSAQVQLDALYYAKYDPELTFLFFASYLNEANAIDAEEKISESIAENIEQYKEFLLKDAVAWMHFWQRLRFDEHNERSAAELFCEIRREVIGEVVDAFAPIIGCNRNSGFIHYSPSECKLERGILLIDSGSKLGDFCSDVSRVFLLGENNDEFVKNEVKVAYTNVLKAHIAVATAEFDEYGIDELVKLAARYVNFPHALGHGVGKVVHAYPSIAAGSKAKLRKGMIVTNEPGFYCDEFGIRLESMMRVVDSEAKGKMRFEYLTFVPFEKKLIIYELLTENERTWLSEFHEMCYKKLKGYCDNGFLQAKC